MHREKRRATLILMAIAAAALPVFAQLNLNPLVTVLASPSGPVPGDCATGETTAVPRAVIGEPAEPVAAPPAPAPSNELRTALRRLQSAAASDNYPELKSALAAARAAAAEFPPGAERNAANDALAVYADVERLWDYAINSATGAFFDATSENGELLSMLNRYPAVGHGLADGTMEVNGQTMYPAREARQLLAAEGSKRLAWMGAAPAPAPAAPVEPPLVIAHNTPVPAPISPAPAPAPVPRARIPKLRPQPTTTPVPAPVPAPVPRVAKKKPAAVTPKPAPVKKPAPVPKAAPTPVPAPVPVPVPAPAPVAAAPVPAPAPAPVPAPVTTTTAAPEPVPAPAPVVSPVPQPAPATPAEKPEAVGGRINLLLALILIVIGLGVLIFLFRASD